MAEPIRYYAEEHYYGAVVHGLRLHGIDVLTAQEAGRSGLPDPDQLAFATAEERVMLTFDPDFLALHTRGASHAGIAWCPATKYSFGSLIQMLVLLHGVMDRDGMRNHLEYL